MTITRATMDITAATDMPPNASIMTTSYPFYIEKNSILKHGTGYVLTRPSGIFDKVVDNV